MIQIDKIFAYGCSFTSGEELMDHVVIDKLSEQEVDRIKREYTNHRTGDFYAKYFTPEYCSNPAWFVNPDPKHVAQKVREYQEQFAWPRWLSDKFNVPWVNRGLGGSSLAYSIHKLEEDLLSGNITDKSLVVIGAPAPNRQFWIDDSGEEHNIIYGHFNAQWWNWPNKKSYEEYVLQYANPKNMLCKYYQELKYLDLLSSRHNNRILWFTISTSWDALIPWYGQGQIDGHISETMINTAENFQSRLKTAQYFTTESYPVCGFGHAKYDKHVELSETIYGELLERF